MAQPGRRGLSDLGRQNGRRSTVTEFRPERKGRAQKSPPPPRRPTPRVSTI
jgi:hypothetical protein